MHHIIQYEKRRESQPNVHDMVTGFDKCNTEPCKLGPIINAFCSASLVGLWVRVYPIISRYDFQGLVNQS